MKILQGSYCKKRKGLSEFEGVLEEWLSVMDTYAEMTRGEYFHFYRERENVSALAGAGWRRRFVAMSEFSHAKLKQDPKKSSYLGRCDLYLANDQKEYFIEAKHNWLSLQTRKTWGEAFSIGCINASNAAISTKGSEEFAVLGVTFFGLYIPMCKAGTEAHVEKVDYYLQSLEDYLQTCPFDAMAWYFPKSNRSDQGLTTKNIIPGIVMSVENVSIKSRK